MANSLKSAQYLIESRLLDAARGDANAYFDLGIAFSTGSGGVDVDLIQAHKWFNLAALGGIKGSGTGGAGRFISGGGHAIKCGRYFRQQRA